MAPPSPPKTMAEANPFVGKNMERERVNRLPQPYRFLSKIVDEILDTVGERIYELELQKRSEIAEHDLGSRTASYVTQIPAVVTML